MAIVGPWAIAVYGDKVKWGAVPVPTKDGKDAKDTFTFSDEKSVGMYVSCQNTGTAWEFLKFATNKDNDGKLLEGTGQMPMRTDLTTAYPDYFSRRMPTTPSSPTRQAGRSRSPSSRTRSRCGRRSGTRTASR